MSSHERTVEDPHHRAYQSAISVLLRQMREHRGLDQLQVARRLSPVGSNSFLSRCERDQRQPGLEFLTRVCAVYGVDYQMVITQAYLDSLDLIGAELAPVLTTNPHWLHSAALFTHLRVPLTLLPVPHWCCGQQLSCRCANSCDCACAGCHVQTVPITLSRDTLVTG